MASSYPEVQNYLCLYSTATVSEISAVKAIFGEIAVRGTLPVTLPHIASRGAGLQRGVGWKVETESAAPTAKTGFQSGSE